MSGATGHLTQGLAVAVRTFVLREPGLVTDARSCGRMYHPLSQRLGEFELELFQEANT